MTEINLDINEGLINSHASDNSEQSEDTTRTEMPWTSKQDAILSDYITACEKKSEWCDTLHKHNKKRNIMFSIPCMMVPIVLSGVTPFIDSFPLVTSGALIFTGCLSTMKNLFQFERKSERFDNFSYLYNQLGAEMELELRKPKRFRVAADVFIERSFMKLNFLNKSCPS